MNERTELRAYRRLQSPRRAKRWQTLVFLTLVGSLSLSPLAKAAAQETVGLDPYRDAPDVERAIDKGFGVAIRVNCGQKAIVFGQEVENPVEIAVSARQTDLPPKQGQEGYAVKITQEPLEAGITDVVVPVHGIDKYNLDMYANSGVASLRSPSATSQLARLRAGNKIVAQLFDSRNDYYGEGVIFNQPIAQASFTPVCVTIDASN